MFLTFERECNCVDFKICFLALSSVGGFFQFFFFHFMDTESKHVKADATIL